MGAQRGQDLLVKMDVDGTNSFQTMGGLRTKRLAFNMETVDVTDADSAGRWRELLDRGGLRRATVSGSGIFKDSGTDEIARQVFFEGALRKWQLIIPDFGSITGLFQIVSLEYGASHTSEITFDIALESASEIAFEAL
ncbi:phage major tail protein, TP901-1 family [Limoniibacter endophyticus]|uniref:Tail protein n=1 Tax=Limoniibacter endophyticus TaxID=1565040 RepID=A0A8J3GH34_9HYPH|nr:phage major tail protein, TP901-1 family [Limoniibacter endophyticus]GHC69313.1 tail protein [Limoniibacter endophyticus]